VMVGSSVLLGAVFLAVGYCVSAAVQGRGAAGGLAVGIWLLFVLIYDMALLGLLVADKGRTVTPGVLNVLLLLNPADAYRLLNLTGSGEVGRFAGMAGIGRVATLTPAAILAALALWTAVPLAAAAFLLRRREL
ncbi:MAG: ABC transporter permease subunit, partial [Rhodospirillaceae bacterium]|nr:ABC transporter permease subunit [Rhodospirillaceae bacterium]